MAKYYTNVVGVYYGGYNLGPDTTQASVTLQASALDLTAFTFSAERTTGGIRADEVTWGGLYDDVTGTSTGGSDVALNALVGAGTNNAFSIVIGTGLGAVSYVGTAALTSVKTPVDIADLVKIDAEFKPDGVISKGVAWPVSVTTGSAASTYIDAGALSTGTAKLFIHVLGGTFGGGTAKFSWIHATATSSVSTAGTLLAVNGISSHVISYSGALGRNTRVEVATTATSLRYVAIQVRTFYTG